MVGVLGGGIEAITCEYPSIKVIAIIIRTLFMVFSPIFREELQMSAFADNPPLEKFLLVDYE